MTPHDLVSDLVDRMLDGWNARRGDLVAACLTDDVDYADLALGAHLGGAAAVGAFAESMSATFSTDARFTRHRLLVDDDGFAYEWTLRGTNDAGGAGGMPATGRAFVLEGVSVGRVRDGLIARQRDHWDLGSYLRQVGVLGGPPEDQAPSADGDGDGPQDRADDPAAQQAAHQADHQAADQAPAQDAG